MRTKGRVGVSARDLEDRLVERCKRGDPDAWRELVETYRRHMVTYAERWVGGPDAEDAAHDALLYAWQRIDAYDPHRARIGSWLQLITRGQCYNMSRKADALGRPSVDLDEWNSPVGGDVESEVDARIALERVDAVAGSIPRDERAAFEAWLCYHSVTAAAEATGKKRSTLSRSLTLARERLRSAVT